ncbi:MAG TPA: AI-2E family transporter, partial [Acetobacteraceae bacterium]
MTPERLLMALLLGGVAVGCTLVLWPFSSAILWASILTFTTWPVYAWLRVHGRLGAAVASGAMVAITAVVVVLPLALAVPGGASDVAELERAVQDALATGLPPPPQWLDDIPIVGGTATALWTSWVADLDVMAAFFRPYFGIAAGYGLRVLLGLANGVLEFVLALLIAFFLYLSGESLAAKLHVLLHRIAGPRADQLIGVTGATVRGVVYGILG